MIRIGNCSGFYGDRLAAMREMLEGGPLDYLTGDYLAELTMLILGKDRMKDADLGYAKTFLRQLTDCLALAQEKQVKIVANAGGLNPAGLAERIREAAVEQGIEVTVAHVEGDDLIGRAAELGWDGALTANAYLGAFGIAEALKGGADIVVTGRVTDASVIVGPAIAAYGWGREDYDHLAGAVAAGHVIECGTQATGGNFSGFADIDTSRPLGFPIAEIDADGSSVITKHPGTGGAVTVDTVTAQLVYEIGDPVYLNPDVSTRLDTIELTADGEDRVRLAGVRGTPPPATTKVALNSLGGFRNSVEFVLTGLDIEAKAAWVRAQLTAALDALPLDEVAWELVRTDRADPATEPEAAALLRCHVKSQDAKAAGRAFSGAAIELALASYPGFHVTAPPSAASPFGVYRAAYVPQTEVPHVVVLADGTRIDIPAPATTAPDPARGEGASGGDTSLHGTERSATGGAASGAISTSSGANSPSSGAIRGEFAPLGESGSAGGSAHAEVSGETVRKALGRLVYARSGDKGGAANVGVWVPAEHPARVDAYAWLAATLTPDRVRELLPEAADLDVHVHRLPNLAAVNVVIERLLGDGVASSTRFDPQAKAVGEWLRARLVDIPRELLV